MLETEKKKKTKNY